MWIVQEGERERVREVSRTWVVALELRKLEVSDFEDSRGNIFVQSARKS